jgi:uracil-DNA glycosylase
MEACVAWFKAEVAAVAPRIILVLGATAAQALFGRAFRVTRDLGRLVPSASAPHAFATVHPSALCVRPTSKHAIVKSVESWRICAR